MPEPKWHAALSWPLVAIDFEASSLEQDSYPIEVGLASWSAPDAPVLGWSTLIRPTPDWTRHGHWSAESAKVHGIPSRDLIARGQAPAHVAAALNAVLGTSGVAWCDGGAYDAHWLRALFKAGGVRPLFILGDWYRLIAKLKPSAREHVLEQVEQTPIRHRARADAEQLLLTIAHAVGVTAPRSGDLAQIQPALAQITPTESDGIQALQ